MEQGQENGLITLLKAHGTGVLPHFAALHNCDYRGEANGVGKVHTLKILAAASAAGTAQRHRETAMRQFWRHKKKTATQINRFVHEYRKSVNCFRHQVVFDATTCTGSQRPLMISSVDTDISKMPEVGVANTDAEQAQQFASGLLSSRAPYAPRTLPEQSSVLRPGQMEPTLLPMEWLPAICQLPPLEQWPSDADMTIH